MTIVTLALVAEYFAFYFFSYKRIILNIFTRSGNTMNLDRQEAIYIFLKNLNRSFFDYNGAYLSFWNTTSWISTETAKIVLYKNTNY